MSKKIIIAEDSSVIQNLTRRILSIQNYEITSVKNGQDLLDEFEKQEFDLILLDLHMPKVDGMECARRIRDHENETKRNIPIVAITGNAKNYSMEDFKNAGINDYVPKPLNYDAMVEKVKIHLGENAD